MKDFALSLIGRLGFGCFAVAWIVVATLLAFGLSLWRALR